MTLNDLEISFKADDQGHGVTRQKLKVRLPVIILSNIALEQQGLGQLGQTSRGWSQGDMGGLPIVIGNFFGHVFIMLISVLHTIK